MATTEENQQPKNHGRITPKEPEINQRPWLPPELSNRVLSYGLGYEKEATIYGMWKVRILAPVRVRGHVMHPGDEAEVVGTDAVELVLQRQAEIIDPRRGKMEQLQQEAAKLNIPLRARDLAKKGVLSNDVELPPLGKRR